MPNERDDLARVIEHGLEEWAREDLPEDGLSQVETVANAILAQWVPDHDRAVREEQRERDAQIAEKGGLWGPDPAVAAAIRAEGTDR